MVCAHIFRRSMEYHSYLHPLRLQMQDSAFHAPAPLYHYKPFQAFPHSLQPQSPHLYGRYLFYTQKNQLSPSWFSLYLQIQEGKIRYDGINITKIKKDDLRRSLGIVLQDTHLFTGTIKENIRYGKLDATDEEVYEAARLAHADQFIKMLPKGYDTMLSGDGEELSQGQRQLLSIARAAVANPPVLILDEATSSIDTRTESIVQKGMDNLMKGRTVFVIAHRLSTIRNSDAIIVLDHGKIIERGDHEDLIKLKGTYYQLYTGKLELS